MNTYYMFSPPLLATEFSTERLLFLGNMWQMTRTIISNNLMVIGIQILTISNFFIWNAKAVNTDPKGAFWSQLFPPLQTVILFWRHKHVYSSALDPEGARRRCCSKHFTHTNLSNHGNNRGENNNMKTLICQNHFHEKLCSWDSSQGVWLQILCSDFHRVVSCAALLL